MLTRYPTLQSGFLGYPGENLLVRPEEPILTPVQMLVSSSPKRTQQDYFYSPTFERLNDQIFQDPLSIRDFGLQAEVFKTLGVLFDRKGIYNWMRIQEEGKNISRYHTYFLEDTLSAVLLGKRRTHQPPQWATMISAANEPSVKKFKASEITERVGARPPDTLDELLSHWVDTLGWPDLMGSMQVIFGRRTLPASFGAPSP